MRCQNGQIVWLHPIVIIMSIIGQLTHFECGPLMICSYLEEKQSPMNFVRFKDQWTGSTVDQIGVFRLFYYAVAYGRESYSGALRNSDNWFVTQKGHEFCPETNCRERCRKIEHFDPPAEIFVPEVFKFVISNKLIPDYYKVMLSFLSRLSYTFQIIQEESMSAEDPDEQHSFDSPSDPRINKIFAQYSKLIKAAIITILLFGWFAIISCLCYCEDSWKRFEQGVLIHLNIEQLNKALEHDFRNVSRKIFSLQSVQKEIMIMKETLKLQQQTGDKFFTGDEIDRWNENMLNLEKYINAENDDGTTFEVMDLFLAIMFLSLGFFLVFTVLK